MAGLALLVRWQEDRGSASRVQQLLSQMPHRGTIQHLLAATPTAWLGSVGQSGQDPPHAQLATANAPLCVADSRLDNRQELHKTLLPSRVAATDSELILQGYQRWGTGLAERLVGDFALAIWDPAQECLYAARDPFGIRPFYYTRDSTGLTGASEIEPLVRTATMPTLEPGSILDYLEGEHRLLRETFFEGIWRLLPGHWLLVSRTAVREQRYWHPPRLSGRPLRQRDHASHFRQLLRQAVADRLDARRPMVLQLSGGLDSSSIVCLAAEIARQPGYHGSVTAASAVFRGLDCDETPLIDAVIRKTGMAACQWDGTAALALDPDAFCVDHPWGGSSPTALEGDLRLAKDQSAAAVLSGFGGDELLFERGIFRDLAAGGRFLELFRQARLAPRYSVSTAAFFVRDALQALVPVSARGLYRRLRRRDRPVPPPWLGPQLRKLLLREPPADQAGVPVWGGASQTQEFTWHWLTRPSLWSAVELQTLRAARQGVELRFPYLDRRLADFVLTIPFEQRLPGGQMKRLLREAMAGLLPPAIRGRRQPTTFNSVLGLQFHKHRQQLSRLFSADVPWRCWPFVDQGEMRKILQHLDTVPGTPLTYPLFQLVLDIAQLEEWLIGLHRNTINLRDFQ